MPAGPDAWHLLDPSSMSVVTVIVVVRQQQQQHIPQKNCEKEGHVEFEEVQAVETNSSRT